MAWKICLVLLFTVSAFGKQNDVASMLKEAPLVMEPGAAMIRGNPVEEVSHGATQRESKGAPECQACEKVMTELYNLIKNDTTRADILKWQTSVCELIPPGSYRTQCDQMSKYTDLVFNLLINLGPNGACKFFGLCPSDVFGEREYVLKEKPKASPKCASCVEVMTELDNVIKNEKTRQEILQWQKRLCALIPPGSYSTECDQISKYIDLVFNLLTKLGPNGACKFFGLCPSDLFGSSHPTGQHPKLNKLLKLRGRQ